jgi:glucose/arabinose dehydrogenase
MQRIIALIISLGVVVGALLALAYFFFSQSYFLPWNQKPNYTFLDQPLSVTQQEDFEIDPTVQGSLEDQIVIQQVDVDYTDIDSALQEEVAPETIVANFYDKLQKPRGMTLSPYGDLVVGDIKSDAVYVLIDEDGDFTADTKITLIDGLNNPHSVFFYGKDLYIGETDKVRVLYNVYEGYGFDANRVIIDNLTDASGHFTRTVRVIDDKLYVSVGSSCNTCIESNENRATVLRYNLDGTGKEIFAQGLRNTVDFEKSPFDGKIYGVENGRDWLGDLLPAEEVNVLTQGSHYGWPFCYSNQVYDEEFGGDFDCSRTQGPVWEMQAHTAPLGITFYNGNMFPEWYGDALITQHGSWNSTVPVGYKVERLDFDEQNNIIGQEDLLTIFLRGETVRGRPVDVLVGSKGEIYFSDDFAGRIYVMYKQ